ncbi:MAG TPA: LytTR family DNA-binding domain-containing protein [Bacteroidales bacterium]|nr:LytTR family DNA-binding domain-containing protein [Bacteroidales bacterium]HPS17269.1 LytTR family DNA-binding domain-containing protein [Bacteroidales bacterium]
MKKPWKTLIIDDEKPARQRMMRLLNDYQNQFNVCGEAVNGDEAFEKIEKEKPDIIFLDIQMPGKNVFTMLADLEHKPFVIFCTAYDQYALEAFNTYSVDYLLKPVESERLQLTIQKIEKISNGNNNELYENIKQINLKTPLVTSIAHKLGNKIIPVKIEDIIYFIANEKYVNFYNQNNETFITDQTLSHLSQKLQKDFLRISKSILINRDHVKEIHKYFKGKFVFIMNDKAQTKLVSGRMYYSEIKQMFEI